MTRTVESECPRTAVTAGGWPILCERTDVAQRTCSIEGCERPHQARGWCPMHYARWKTHGDPMVAAPPKRKYGKFTCVMCGTQRQATNGVQLRCPPCRKLFLLERERRLRRENPEIFRERGRRSRAKNPEKARAGTRRWYAENADRARESARLAYWAKVKADEQAFRSLSRKQARAWYAAHPGRASEYARRRRAQKRANGMEPYRTADIFERDGWVCGLCGETIDRAAVWPDVAAVTIDHIIPISLGGADAPWNVQAAHFGCNCSKHNRVVV